MFDARMRMWIAGRALSLRLDGVSAVEASAQATLEAQEMTTQTKKPRKKRAA